MRDVSDLILNSLLEKDFLLVWVAGVLLGMQGEILFLTLNMDFQKNGFFGFIFQSFDFIYCKIHGSSLR